MACYRKEFLPEAGDDLDRILDYLGHQPNGHELQNSLIGELNATLETMSRFPRSFPCLEGAALRQSGYRKARFASYLAIFRIAHNCVYVYRIFHQRQDYARRL